MKLARPAWLHRRDPRVWILAGLALLGGLEGVLRSQDYGRVVRARTSARFGWQLLSHPEVVEGLPPIAVSINSQGYRDREFDTPQVDELGRPERRAELFRIAVLGNSVSWGASLPIYVRYDRALCDLVQERLTAVGDPRRATAMNFAVPGYTLEQMAAVFEDHVRPYRPDVVVLALCYYDLRPMRPFADPPKIPFWSTWQTTALYDFGKRHLLGGWKGEVQAQQEEFDEDFAFDPFEPAHISVWHAAQRRIGELIEAAHSDGTEVVLIWLPSLDDVLAPARVNPRKALGGFARERRIGFVEPMSALRTEMRLLLEDLGQFRIDKDRVWGPYREVDTIDALRGIEQNCFLEFDPIHLSAVGHRVVAEELLEELVESGVLGAIGAEQR